MIGWLLRVAFDVRSATHVGAVLAGAPELGDTLEAVCERESLCAPAGVHEGDLWMSDQAWRAAVRVGWLTPSTCAWHRLEQGPWSTRGPHGLVAAYSLRHLPCAPPWVLEIPLVSAYAAAMRANSWECDQVARCISWRGDA